MPKVDIAFFHRSDPGTPMEEVVWATHDMVDTGQATFWATRLRPLQPFSLLV